MRKLIAFVTAAAVCLCMVGCVGKPQGTEPAGETESTGTVSVPEETAQATTPPGTQGTIAVPAPDEMPDAPTADYTLPGNERPGDRITDTQTS